MNNLTEDIRSDLTKIFSERKEEVVAEGNMSYAMMENTSRDLYACLQALQEHGSIEAWRKATDPSTYEEEGIISLIETCKDMVNEFGGEINA
jgi:hypothetical protein